MAVVVWGYAEEYVTAQAVRLGQAVAMYLLNAADLILWAVVVEVTTDLFHLRLRHILRQDQLVAALAAHAFLHVL
jgi:hypothetical protein